MTPVSIAIIGCGGRAGGHAAAAAKSEAVQLVGACDIVEDRARSAGEAWGVPWCTDYHKLLGDPTVEAVSIVTDVGPHIAIARDALAAGKHVIVEKPLGDDVAAARQLVGLGESSGLVAFVCFQLRFSPLYIALHKGAQAVDPVQVHFSRQRGMMKPQFLNPTPFCGAMDFCAHDFDQVAWLMGREPVAVTASVRRNTFTKDTGATDVLTVLIDFGDGCAATVVSSIGAPQIGSKVDIVGARGNVQQGKGVPLAGCTFEIHDPGGDATPIDLAVPDGADPDVALQSAFAAAIRKGRASQAATLRDGLSSLLVTLAALRSADEGRRVELAELGA